MGPYVMAEDLYRFKLALILGRGKRLKKILKNYPTEKRFKNADIKDLAEILGIKNHDSRILKRLKSLDTTYDKMVTFNPHPYWSKVPEAERVMGIDTEYLKSNLDSIQYAVFDDFDAITTGFIFTNNRLAPAVSREEGIDYLLDVIDKYQPEIIVGHNFNSDIKVLETAYGDNIPALYHYDDTMDLLRLSNLSNIIGSNSLSRVVKKIFKEDVVGLFSAYEDLSLLMEYGLKDAVYPVFLRYYIINGRLPELNFILKLDKIIKETNRKLWGDKSLELTLRV